MSVRDEGIGLPAEFDPATSKRLGMRLINALAKQLKAELSRSGTAIGTTFILLIPVGTGDNNCSPGRIARNPAKGRAL